MSKVDHVKLAAEALNAKFPVKGFFSTLDEAVEKAPMQKAPGKQWASYLKPGREVDRSGTKFGLKKEEIDFAGDQFRDALASDDSISKTELLNRLREGRLDFGIAVGAPTGQKNDVTSALLGAIDPKTYKEIKGYQDLLYKSARIPNKKIIKAIAEGVDPSEILKQHVNLDKLRDLYSKYGTDPVKFMKPQGKVYRTNLNYGSWATPKTRSPEEVVTTLPGFGDMFPSHFRDHPGSPGEGIGPGLSWSRMRLFGPGITNNRNRLIDEIQSDYHQGLDKGMKHLRNEDTGITRYALPEQLQDLLNLGFKEIPNPDVPFGNKGWIDHELRKALATSAVRGDKQLSLVDPHVVGTRYGGKQGLERFYSNIVTPRFKALASKYGLDVRDIEKDLKRKMPDEVLRIERALEGNQEPYQYYHTPDPATRRLYDLLTMFSNLDRDNLPEYARGLSTYDLNRYVPREREQVFTPEGIELLNDLEPILRQRSRDLVDSTREGFGKPGVFSTILLPKDAAEHILTTGVPLYNKGGLAKLKDKYRC